MNGDEQLEDLVRFGAQTQQFLQSDIGQYLLDKSKEQIEAAVAKLKRVDPGNVTQIRALQDIIARNEDVEQWLGEIIQAGFEARELLAGGE